MAPEVDDEATLGELIELLDTLSEHVEVLGHLAGDDPEAQENRAVWGARAHLARSEARRARSDMAEVRLRARDVADRARALRAAWSTDPAIGLSAHGLVETARAVVHRLPRRPDTASAAERLADQARHLAPSVAWSQVSISDDGDVRSWSAGELGEAAVAAVETGPRAAVLAGAGALEGDPGATDEAWAGPGAAAGVRAVLVRPLGPRDRPDGALILCLTETVDDGTRLVVERFVAHAHAMLSAEPVDRATTTRTAVLLDRARAALTARLRIDDDESWEVLLELARHTGSPVRTVAEQLAAGDGPSGTEPEDDSPSPVGPATLRRALAYIDEHASEDIGIDDIADAARLGPRGVQQLFRRHRRTTPLSHLRDVRLGLAHDELSSADPRDGATVASIAAHWRFAHPGRFSVQYRERYGCPPSTTLRA